jgi:hypothetical protein
LRAVISTSSLEMKEKEKENLFNTNRNTNTNVLRNEIFNCRVNIENSYALLGARVPALHHTIFSSKTEQLMNGIDVANLCDFFFFETKISTNQFFKSDSKER